MFEATAVNKVELAEFTVVERSWPNKSPVKVFKSGLIDSVRFPFNLMVEFNLGVSVIETYVVKRVDYDFFNDEL